MTLTGPDPGRLPADVDGLHQVLLRIEASDDREADSNLAAAGAGNGIVHSGADGDDVIAGSWRTLRTSTPEASRSGPD